MATITLTPDLEHAISERASREGTILEILSLDKLNAYFLTPPTPIESDTETMEDFLHDFIGCIDSRGMVPGGANMSEYSGRELGNTMMKKHREELCQTNIYWNE